jgi:hypothetical protein
MSTALLRVAFPLAYHNEDHRRRSANLGGPSGEMVMGYEYEATQACMRYSHIDSFW